MPSDAPRGAPGAKTFPGEPRIRSPHGVETVRSRRRSWNGVTAHALEISLAPDRAWIDLSSESDTLSIVLEVTGGSVETRQGIDIPNPAHRAAPRPLSFAPAGMSLWGYTDGARTVREARLDFDASALSRTLGEDLDRVTMQTPRLTFHNDRIWQVGSLLAAQCDAPDAFSQLYGDSLTVALFIDLLRLGREAEPRRRRGGLAPFQLRRATEYIEANLSSGVTLQDLAEMIGLSQSQFGRAFKASTGLTPHRWQIDARIARARQLLLESDLPLAQIALATGFAEQSHFSRVFRQVVGVSPSTWQRDRKSY
jgi:AraC family transcriptional regulator